MLLSSPAAPLGYFLHSAGPATGPTMILGWMFSGICIVVCLIITVLLMIAIFRKRPNANPQDVERGGNGIRAVYIGTAVSTVILFGMAIYALIILNAAAQPPGPPALTITVIGYQWWWEVIYDDDTPAKRMVTANEIHIPVGVPVLFKLKSADVIHAFWAPLLAGKTQTIPSLVNRQWLQADKPGVYHGQCTQYCGVQHAHMGFDIVAQNKNDFAAWLAAQRTPAPATHSVGKKIFLTSCAGCHAVNGIQATGGHGPDLTHLQTRSMIGAGLLTNTPEHLADWVGHVQELKPGARMPDFALSAKDQTTLLDYLMELQ